VPIQVAAGAGGNIPLTDEVSINAVPGKKYDIVLSANGITNFSGMEVKVTYDPAVFDLLDACVFTKNCETTAGAIAPAGIIVNQASPGIIKFAVDRAIPSGKQWAGTLNVIRLQAKTTAQSTISVGQ
jgi:hypothetical protein